MEKKAAVSCSSWKSEGSCPLIQAWSWRWSRASHRARLTCLSRWLVMSSRRRTGANPRSAIQSRTTVRMVEMRSIFLSPEERRAAGVLGFSACETESLSWGRCVWGEGRFLERIWRVYSSAEEAPNCERWEAMSPLSWRCTGGREGRRTDAIRLNRRMNPILEAAREMTA